MQTLSTLAEVIETVRQHERSGVPLFVRYSRGPAVDGRNGRSRDHVTGALHSGLSAVALLSIEETYRESDDPVEQFDGVYYIDYRLDDSIIRNTDERIAARLVEYVSLMFSGLTGTICWLCTGEIVGRDSDGAFCLTNVVPVARVAIDALEEARAVERANR